MTTPPDTSAERPSPPVDPGERLRHAGQTGWGLIGVAGALAVVGFVAFKLAAVIPPILLAWVIIVILEPLVARLERWIPRPVAVALLYLSILGLVALAVVLLVPVIQTQIDELRETWPELVDKGRAWLDDLAEASEGTAFEFTPEELGERVAEWATALGGQAGRLIRIGDMLLTALIVLISAPVVAFYLLVDLPRLRKLTRSLLPPNMAGDARYLAGRLNAVLGGFIRGQLLVATIVGILTSFGLALIGMPFWLVLGAIAGTFDLIPMLGPIVGAVPAVLVALIAEDLATAGWVVLVMVVVQQIESQVVSPLVLNRTVKLHPAAVILALIAAGSLFGFLGLLIAAPAVAALKVIAGYLWRVHFLGEAVGNRSDGAGDRRAREPAGEIPDRWVSLNGSPLAGLRAAPIGGSGPGDGRLPGDETGGERDAVIGGQR